MPLGTSDPADSIATRRIRRRSFLGAAVGGLLALVGLGASPVAFAYDSVRVGIVGGEDEDVWRVVAAEAEKQGLTVKPIVFNDYTQPNEALENGELDANAFQHKPYLDNQIKTRGYHITPVGYTAVWPIGLYSHKVSFGRRSAEWRRDRSSQRS